MQSFECGLSHSSDEVRTWGDGTTSSRSMSRKARTHALSACALTCLASACSMGRSSGREDIQAGDPKSNHVPIAALAGWNGTLVLDQGKVGVWTVGVLKVFPQYGCPEIVGIDDQGRCHVIWSYSGKWTTVTAIADGKWLGGLALADVDPRIAGNELYTGSQQGNLYQVVAYRNTLLDYRFIGQIPGREVHTIVAADLVPERKGIEEVVFTSPGGLYLATPRDGDRDGFDVRLVEDLAGRVRDAIVLPPRPGTSDEIATIGRHGRIEILGWREGKPTWKTVFEAPMGMGRLALRPGSVAGAEVMYSTSDDGMIRRHERSNGEWRHEIVYAGHPGPRGVCAGHFDADPQVETIAVFGYSKRVELLSRRNGKWTAETIFEDRDKGHWVTTGEVDGRNGTDEIVASGYSGRIVLLSRPPGYGLTAPQAAIDREGEYRPTKSPNTRP